MPAGVKTEVRTYQMYINGEWVDSKSGETFPVYDPSTEEVIAQVPDANAEDVDRAVAAAKAAFEDGRWSQTTAQERGRVLFRLAEKIRQNAAKLAEIECRNTGKPIVEAEFDINDVSTCFEYEDSRICEYCPGQCGEPDAERADWRGGTDYSLELPASYGCMEIGSGIGGWMHLRLETGGADTANYSRGLALVRGSRSPSWCGQHSDGLR